jgi:hypothetical protein
VGFGIPHIVCHLAAVAVAKLRSTAENRVNNVFFAFTQGVTVGNLFPGSRSRSGSTVLTATIGSFIELSDTRMAAPMVSGAAAHLIHKFGASTTPDTIKAKLMKSASKNFRAAGMGTDTFVTPNVTETIPNDMLTVGAGYLDIQAALNHADTAPGNHAALSSSLMWACANAKPSTNCVSLSHGPNAMFANGVSSPAWSSPTVCGSTVLWGDSVLWGDVTRLINPNMLQWGTSLWPDLLAAHSRAARCDGPAPRRLRFRSNHRHYHPAGTRPSAAWAARRLPRHPQPALIEIHSV